MILTRGATITYIYGMVPFIEGVGGGLFKCTNMIRTPGEFIHISGEYDNLEPLGKHSLFEERRGSFKVTQSAFRFITKVEQSRKLFIILF